MREIVKDPVVLDFLAADPVRERDLSRALTDNLARFLHELGTGFAFVGASTPLAVTEWRRLPAKVRQALPTAEDLSATMTRTVREIESSTTAT